MRLQLIILAMFLVNLARKPLEALYSKLLEARWPGFHADLEKPNDPCGYCDNAQPSNDPNDICQDCWDEMLARDEEHMSRHDNEPTYPSPEEMVEHPDPLPNPEPITLAEAFAFLRDDWPIEADPPLKASEVVAIAQDHMNREGE
tara:strand:- start:2165 stop:2599 length:435 start_codon:yes stop_codon:yes gene_type:complete